MYVTNRMQHWGRKLGRSIPRRSYSSVSTKTLDEGEEIQNRKERITYLLLNNCIDKLTCDALRHRRWRWKLFLKETEEMEFKNI